MEQNKKIEEVLQEFLEKHKFIDIHEEKYLYDKLLSLIEMIYVYNKHKGGWSDETNLKVLRRSLSGIIKHFDKEYIQEFLDATKKLTKVWPFRDVKDHKIFIVYYFVEKLNREMEINYIEEKKEILGLAL